MRELDITALMCSKVCHDLISPVGALANGLEILAEDDDAEMREQAMALIEASARQASAKLQFARLAFGAARSTGDEVELETIEELARGVLEGPKTKLHWDLPNENWPTDKMRLVLNMLAVVNDAIPRGGSLRVAPSDVDGAGPHDLVLKADGPKARVPEGVRFLQGDFAQSEGAVDPSQLDARSIQPFMTHLLAGRLKARLDCEPGEDQVVFHLRFDAD